MFLPLKKIIPKHFGKFNLNQYFIERELKRAWKVVVATTPHLNQDNIRPLYFKNSVYFIGCADSCQANELRFQEKELCQTLNQILNKPLIQQIRFLSY